MPHKPYPAGHASANPDERKAGAEVALLSLNYPPEPTGIASYTGALAAGLAESGFRVTAHVAHPHYPEWTIREGYGGWKSVEQLDKVDVQRRLHYVPRTPRGLRRLISEISFGLRLVFAPWRSPGVIIALSPPLFGSAMATVRVKLTPRRPKLIVWVQDIYSLGLTETGEGGGLALNVARWVEAHTLNAADQIVVLHQKFADYLVGELGVEAAKISVLRNWTHLKPSDPVDSSAAKLALGWPQDTTLVVHTGNMGAKQGLENVVDAARLADERQAPVHFILVGGGGEREHLEEYGRGVSRLTFVDPLDDDKYRLALGAADVLLVNEKPGVSEMAMPCKLTSYFDAGRPVLAATDLSGITASEIAMSGAGVVVPAGRPEDLLDAAMDLGRDAEAASRFGSNGRKHREAVLDEDFAIAQWTSLINRLLSTRA